MVVNLWDVGLLPALVSQIQCYFGRMLTNTFGSRPKRLLMLRSDGSGD